MPPFLRRPRLCLARNCLTVRQFGPLESIDPNVAMILPHGANPDRMKFSEGQALFHLVRIYVGWPVMIGDWSVPMWASWIGLVVAGGLAFFGLRLAERDAR
jgi:hypothetical protein